MKQTAVEYLIDQLDFELELYNSQWVKLEQTFEKAKEMEKQQIIDAHGNQTKKSGGITNYTYILTGDEYYNKTFNK
jgi:hypothetical protein